MLAEFGPLASAGCGSAEKALKLRQNHVENLLRPYVHRTLLEEITERVRVLVARYLQNPFIHCYHHQACGTVDTDTDLQWLTWFHQVRCLDIDFHPPLFHID